MLWLNQVENITYPINVFSSFLSVTETCHMTGLMFHNTNFIEKTVCYMCNVCKVFGANYTQSHVSAFDFQGKYIWEKVHCFDGFIVQPLRVFTPSWLRMVETKQSSGGKGMCSVCKLPTGVRLCESYFVR